MSDIVLVAISRVHWEGNVFNVLVLSRLTCLPKLLGTSIAWLWSLFPFPCRGRVAHELLFCHLFTALVTILGSETALMLSSGNHVHSFVFRPCVLDFSSVSGHVYRSVFYFRVRTRKCSSCIVSFHISVCLSWLGCGRILVNFRDFQMKRKLVEK